VGLRGVVTQRAEEDFHAFVTRSLPSLLRFAHLVSGNAEVAEDLVSTALLRSWRVWERVEDPSAFVRKVIVNLNVSWWRRASRVIPPWLAPAQPDKIAQLDERDRVWRALSSLPLRQRTVLVLRYYEDLSEAEIANVMGTSTGTVKSQASRALRRLADVLGPTSTDVARWLG
jgi:RNA polymerase sigma-70 factor (sigma-E family)